jgi:hypothetical protein
MEKNKGGRLPLYQACANKAHVEAVFALLEAHPDGKCMMIDLWRFFLHSLLLYNQRRSSGFARMSRICRLFDTRVQVQRKKIKHTDSCLFTGCVQTKPLSRSSKRCWRRTLMVRLHR